MLPVQFCWFNISAVLPHFELNFQYVFKYFLNQSKTYLKLEILFVFDVHFYAKAHNWSSICHVWLQNTDLRALLFINKQRLIWFSHKKSWAVLTNESSYALMKHYMLLAIQTKHEQTGKMLLLSGRDTLYGEMQVSLRHSRETLKFWNAAISKYIQLVFYYVM